MIAVDNIIEGRVDKSNLWDVNTETEYHESSAEKERPAEYTHANAPADSSVWKDQLESEARRP
jgi:hypothetical protein